MGKYLCWATKSWFGGGGREPACSWLLPGTVGSGVCLLQNPGFSLQVFMYSKSKLWLEIVDHLVLMLHEVTGKCWQTQGCPQVPLPCEHTHVTSPTTSVPFLLPTTFL